MISEDNLRPEAGAVPFESLFQTQKDAYEGLASMIASAAMEEPGLDLQPHRSIASRIQLDLDRKSRLAIISGGRGTGKTTALLSLMNDITPTHHTLKPEQRSRSDSIPNISILRDRVIWLNILDMSPLPEGAKLFSGVLVRLEHALREALGKTTSESNRNYLVSTDTYESPLLKLQNLQIDVAISWEGNIRQRPGSQDPNIFADEVRRTESLRLQLNTRLAAILEESSDLIRKRGRSEPLFVLPIDDFDLNPPRCLELLELLRALSVKRLFFIVLGDVDIAETLCSLQPAISR